MKERYSPDTCPYCGAWHGEKEGTLGKDGFVCYECLDSELGITYKTVEVEEKEGVDKMLDKKEKYIISISMGGTVYEEEFIGSIEEVKKEADHVASLTFYEDGDTVGVYKEGRFIYYGQPF